LENVITKEGRQSKDVYHENYHSDTHTTSFYRCTEVSHTRKTTVGRETSILITVYLSKYVRLLLRCNRLAALLGISIYGAAEIIM
jgi:hypothetical protein